MSAQALVVEMFRAIERAEGRGSVDRARKAARAAGCEGFRNAEASAWLAKFVKAGDGSGDRTGTGSGRLIKHETDRTGTERGRVRGLTRGKGIPVESLDSTGTNVPYESPLPTPQSLFEAPPPIAKPAAKPAKAKPTRLISAYAGATLQDFATFEPLVSEVLAIDGHGLETKAFAESLKTLAMWRALYGDDALAYGLEQAASRSKGHHYVGPCVKSYAPGSQRSDGKYQYRPGDALYNQADDPDFDPDFGVVYGEHKDRDPIVAAQIAEGMRLMAAR